MWKDGKFARKHAITVPLFGQTFPIHFFQPDLTGYKPVFCGDNLHERCATFEFIYQRESELLLLLLLLLFGLCCDPISDKFPNHINREFTALFVRPIGKLRHNVLTCTGQYKYKKENLRAYIHAPTGIRTHDQYSSGRETRADCAATVIGRDNCLIISLIGFDEAEV